MTQRKTKIYNVNVENRIKPSTIILNPLNGLPSFATFPEIKAHDFSGGPIYLRHGAHWSESRGYGLMHIWKKHFKMCITIEEATSKVTALINNILVTGSKIHYEFGLGAAGKRTTVFKNRFGVVVVEEKTDGLNNCFYSIVTAFKTPNANGSVIGAI